MRLKSLSEIRQQAPEYVSIATLPQAIQMTDYAIEKAYKINELVKKVHKGSYEWYGYLIADAENPELAVDIGMGKNDQNQFAYTRITPEKIEEFRSSLPLEQVINGWIHSHGNLGFRQFSGTDDANHRTVLDYVTSLLKTPIGYKEVPVRDLGLLVEGAYSHDDLAGKSVSIVTDVPVDEARIMETVMGGFSYAVVIGDEGWHEQEIHYREIPVLSGNIKDSKAEAEIITVETGRILTPEDIVDLETEVKEKVKPPRTIWQGWTWGGKKKRPATRKSYQATLPGFQPGNMTSIRTNDIMTGIFDDIDYSIDGFDTEE